MSDLIVVALIDNYGAGIGVGGDIADSVEEVLAIGAIEVGVNVVLGTGSVGGPFPQSA